MLAMIARSIDYIAVSTACTRAIYIAVSIGRAISTSTSTFERYNIIHAATNTMPVYRSDREARAQALTLPDNCATLTATHEFCATLQALLLLVVLLAPRGYAAAAGPACMLGTIAITVRRTRTRPSAQRRTTCGVEVRQCFTSSSWSEPILRPRLGDAARGEHTAYDVHAFVYARQ